MRGANRAESELVAADSMGLTIKNFNSIVGSHIINEQQQELVQIYSNALQRDLLREQAIKSKLDTKFFNLPRKRSKKMSIQSRPLEVSTHNQQASKQIKRSIFGERKPVYRTSISPSISARYGHTLSPEMRTKRFLGSPSLDEREGSYSYRLDELIQSSLVSERKGSRGRNVVTATQRKRMIELKDRSQKEQIIDHIIEEELDRGSSYGKVLTNFEKYNMSFVNYIKKKTSNNIQKAIFHEKLRPKESYVEKFQNFILSELKFSEEARRRLEKVFKGIELQYKRPSKNRQLSERAKK